VRGAAGASEIPVSVKCRIGLRDAAPAGPASCGEDDYGFLAEFVARISEGGGLEGGGIVVHARSAVLSGLSPLKNRSVPPLRPDFVHRLARDFPRLPVTLNGGISGIGEAREIASAVAAAAAAAENGSGEGVIDGVMLGRAMLERPLDLLLVDPDPLFRVRRSGAFGVIAGGTPRMSPAAVIAEYARYAAGEVSRCGRSVVGDVTMPLVLVSEQLRESFAYLEDLEFLERGVVGVHPAPSFAETELRDAFIATWKGLEEISAAASGGTGGGEGNKELKGIDGGSVLMEVAEGGRVPTKKLSKLLKATMGKKVAGKVERNRSENVRQRLSSPFSSVMSYNEGAS